MTDYLVFQLYGPLAAWGAQAVGQERPIEDHPGRSALLGLLAAAAGIDRADDQAHEQLSNACRFAVKLFAPGLVLRDFHTAQVPPASRKMQHLQTRRDELREDKLGTILSYRSYLQDALCTVALESIDDAWPLERLQAHLRTPRFHLYLGRKSCPPALPLNPEIRSAESVKAVLDAYAPAETLTGLMPRDARPRYFWEAGMNAGIDRHYRVPRYDQPLSRRRWQFAPRDEYASLGEEA